MMVGAPRWWLVLLACACSGMERREVASRSGAGRVMAERSDREAAMAKRNEMAFRSTLVMQMGEGD